MKDVTLPMYGLHNVRNACAAIAVARELGIEDGIITRALSEFGGVKRRFTKTGEVEGVTIIDDYGHHPVEIVATLSSARQAVEATGGRVIAVIQPHRYTRLSNLFDAFCTSADAADAVIVADVYSAAEAPIEGANRDALVAGMRQHGHKQVEALADPSALAPMLAGMVKPGDFVICLGAGSISTWAYALPKQLAAELQKRRKERA
jgi:UDP-N-acetylmuramate--alanine ligase